MECCLSFFFFLRKSIVRIGVKCCVHVLNRNEYSDVSRLHWTRKKLFDNY